MKKQRREKQNARRTPKIRDSDLGFAWLGRLKEWRSRVEKRKRNSTLTLSAVNQTVCSPISSLFSQPNTPFSQAFCRAGGGLSGLSSLFFTWTSPRLIVSELRPYIIFYFPETPPPFASCASIVLVDPSLTNVSKPPSCVACKSSTLFSTLIIKLRSCPAVSSSVQH